MQLGKVKEPRGVGTTGPGLMQEVKEEKSGEAGKESDRKGRQRVSRSRGDSEKLPPEEGNRKATPAPQPPSLRQMLGWADPTGTLVCGHVTGRELRRALPVHPPTANQTGRGGLAAL